MAGTVLVLALAGCGGDDDGPTSAASPTAATTESVPGTPTPTGTAEPTGTSDGATLQVASTSVGDVLTDAEGRTLYMFDPDEQGASTCYDQCEQAWPPLTVEGAPVAGEGVDESLLGVVERDDGSSQVTYGRWPLYYFANDAAPGDVNGQGANEVWWVVDGQGQPVRP